MVSKKMIAAGLIAATALTAVPASAASFEFSFGPHWGGPGYHDQHRGWDRHDRNRHGVSAHEVRRSLRNRGYYRIEFLDRRGPTYQVRAERRGRTYFLVVSARTGEIIARHRA